MQIAIALYPEFTALDAMGPYQVLVHVPGAEVVLCAEQAGELSDENGLLHLRVDRTFDDVPAPDVIVVPGGTVTRRMAREPGRIVEWIGDVHAGTTYTTSVCTGALLLGAAGLLDGLDATTHWGAYDELASFGARPTEQRVVRQGKIFTAAGVSAGIDLALTLVAEMHGPEVAQAIQLGIEYDPQPPFDAGAPSKAPAEIVELVRGLMAAG
jgi:transcriptional regulator GlxA family with amidase domain